MPGPLMWEAPVVVVFLLLLFVFGGIGLFLDSLKWVLIPAAALLAFSAMRRRSPRSLM